MSEVGHQLSSQPHIHSGNRSQAAGHFVGGVCESSTEAVGVHRRVERQAALAAKFVQMTNCQLQNISFLQFGDVLALRLKGADHQLLEFIEAAVDASAAFALEHRLHHFAVLVSARDGLRAVVCERVSDLVRHDCVSEYVWLV